MEKSEALEPVDLDPLPPDIAQFAEEAPLRFVIRFINQHEDSLLMIEDSEGRRMLPFWWLEDLDTQFLAEVFFKELLDNSSVGDMTVGDLVEGDDRHCYQYLFAMGAARPMIHPGRYFKPVWVPFTGQYSY